MLKKKILLVLFVLGVNLHGGCCFHRSATPMLPKIWNGNECDAKSLDDDPGQAKLHIMIMYRGGICSHVALRVHCHSKGPIFWDPAGGFATNHDNPDTLHLNGSLDVPANFDPVRRKDVITERVPSINQYLAWRKSIQTDGVEIFEFNISDDEAEELWTILRYGTKRSHPKGAFHTNAFGGTCGLAIAKFLHRFAEDIVTVDTVWYPHNLAKQLYKENPDRVIIYRDGHLCFYIPSENHVE